MPIALPWSIKFTEALKLKLETMKDFLLLVVQKLVDNFMTRKFFQLETCLSCKAKNLEILGKDFKKPGSLLNKLETLVSHFFWSCILKSTYNKTFSLYLT